MVNLPHSRVAPAAALVDASTTDSPRVFPAAITVNAGKPIGELKPIWRMFGADEPNYACMRDGKKLMAGLDALKPGDVFFRAHNLLCTGDGTMHSSYTAASFGRLQEIADRRGVNLDAALTWAFTFEDQPPLAASGNSPVAASICSC